MPAGPSVVAGGEIPYLPAAREQQRQNFANRTTADPLNNCYLPGVPRIMYMEYPFQIFQTAEHLAITFEWSQVYRLIYTAGQPTLHEGIESWMGNSRGRWEGDVLVVEVTDHNDRTWLDAAGTFHSNALRVTERYAMRDANTIDYEATIEDPNVFERPWTIRVPLHRQTDLPRIYEYQCQAEKEEENGAFERDDAHVVSGADPGRERAVRRARRRRAGAAGSHRRDSPPARRQARSLRLVPARRRRRQLRARVEPADISDAGEPWSRR